MIFFIILLLFGCSRNPVWTTVDNTVDSKLFSARESVRGFADSVSMAYMNYLSGVVGDTFVFVDGSLAGLDVNYSGEEITCSNISIINGEVKLSDCLVFGYLFDYDGDAIEK